MKEKIIQKQLQSHPAAKFKLKPIAAAISEEVALITGAIATTAELPQIEFPVAIRIERLVLNFKKYLLNNHVRNRHEITENTTKDIIDNPSWNIKVRLTLAPSNITENSSNCLDANLAPLFDIFEIDKKL